MFITSFFQSFLIKLNERKHARDYHNLLIDRAILYKIGEEQMRTIESLIELPAITRAYNAQKVTPIKRKPARTIANVPKVYIKVKKAA